MKLEFIVRNKRLSCKHAGPLVGDTTSHYTVSFDFDEEWNDLVKVISFRNGGASAQLIYTGECDLPPQVSGKGELDVACHGYRSVGGDVEVVRTFRMARPMRLLAAGPLAEDGGTDFTPSLFAQVMGAVGDAQTAAGQAEQAAKELEQQRTDGEFHGGYYVPRAALVGDSTLQLDFVGSKTDMAPLEYRIPLPVGQGGGETGGGDGIPVPKTAAVGQTIRVAEVDETGKPMAWEPADFPVAVTDTVLLDKVLEEEVGTIATPYFTASEMDELDEIHFMMEIVPTADETKTNWGLLKVRFGNQAGGISFEIFTNGGPPKTVPPYGGKNVMVHASMFRNLASRKYWTKFVRFSNSGSYKTEFSYAIPGSDYTQLRLSIAGGDNFFGVGTKIKAIGRRYQK